MLARLSRISRLRRRRRAAPPRSGSRSRRQLQLTWWRFRRHRSPCISGVVVILFYLVAAFADFLAIRGSARHRCAAQLHRRRRSIHLFDDDGRFARTSYGAARAARPAHVQASSTTRRERKSISRSSREAIAYDLLGLFPTDVHLLGLKNAQPGETLHPARHRPARPRSLVAAHGGDARVAHHRPRRASRSACSSASCSAASRRSTAAWSTSAIQRLIEIMRSMPTIPLWMGLAAALPNTLDGAADLFRHHA